MELEGNITFNLEIVSMSVPDCNSWVSTSAILGRCSGVSLQRSGKPFMACRLICDIHTKKVRRQHELVFFTTVKQDMLD